MEPLHIEDTHMEEETDSQSIPKTRSVPSEYVPNKDYQKETFVRIEETKFNSPSRIGQNAGYLVFHDMVDAEDVYEIVRGWYSLETPKKVEFYAAFWDTLRTLHETNEGDAKKH